VLSLTKTLLHEIYAQHATLRIISQKPDMIYSTLYHYYDSYAKIQTYIGCLSSFLLRSFSRIFCLLL